MTVEAVLLCGGSAKRLKPYLPFNKALAEVSQDTTLLEHQIRWLKENGVDRVILAIDRETYQSIEEERAELLKLATYSVEDEKLGTGGAIKNALSLLNTPFFYFMNVDDIIISKTYSPTKLVDICKTHSGASGTLLLAKTRFPYGIVDTFEERVTGFKQKPVLSYWINTGHYAISQKAVKEYFPEKGGFEENVLPLMAEKNLLYHHRLEGEWITINNLKQLEEAKNFLKQSK
jgi:NDP-sugar pyrophosphorylase family protein